MKINLELLVMNDAQDEVFVKFRFDLDEIHGYYLDSDDAELVNLVTYGQNYSVKKTYELMTHLNEGLS